MKVLITGGAGFIGTHLARRLLREGCAVTILDNFSPQIHGGNSSLAPDLAAHVDLRVGDVRDSSTVLQALRGQEVVVHLAAETGTGQSMYEVLRYEDVNVRGTAVLMDCLINRNATKLRKVVLASSRAIYGEGKYECPAHGVVYPEGRAVEDMRAGRFEPRCPVCGAACVAQPTTEDSPAKPCSFYGLTKYMQEQVVTMFAKAFGFGCFALRYQNVYGPGQSLHNPYTGILAIFSTQARMNQPINIFEDGQESRDFVYVEDVVEATWRSIVTESTQPEVLNVGSGERVTVSDVVREISQFFCSQSPVTVSGMFRQGDIRHNVADLRKSYEAIGFTPQWRFHEGIAKFLAWAASQQVSTNRYQTSLHEMRERGLLHG